ncbi:alpha/beta hydrolase [Lactovum odontotermitis]
MASLLLIFPFVIAALVAIFLIHRLLSFVEQRKIDKRNNYHLINGKKLYFYEAGQGIDLIVLLSGSGIACPFMDMQPLYNSKLQEKCRFLIIDRLGSGISDDAKDERNLDKISVELMSLIEARRGTGRVFLAGHSLAGLIVAGMAQRYPEKVDSILLLDAPSLSNAVNFRDPFPKMLLTVFKYGRILGLARIYSFFGHLFALFSKKYNANVRFQAICLNKSYFSTAMQQERLNIQAYGAAILDGGQIESKTMMISSTQSFTQWNEEDCKIFKDLEQYQLDTRQHFIHQQYSEYVTEKLESLTAQRG